MYLLKVSQTEMELNTQVTHRTYERHFCIYSTAHIYSTVISLLLGTLQSLFLKMSMGDLGS